MNDIDSLKVRVKHDHIQQTYSLVKNVQMSLSPASPQHFSQALKLLYYVERGETTAVYV